LSGALTDGARTVQLPVQQTFAAHRTADFARVIVVRGGSNMLDLYENGALVKSYPVATGQPAYPTPMGQFFIIGKQVNPVWINPHSSWSVGMPEYVPAGPDNPLGTRAMQLDADGIYIHGTPEDDSIGSHASHGCIRMHMSDAEDLFTRVGVGTPVLIVPS
jgi:lipoprotein-anchoring transpeptidase ErfK/SrfK